MKECLHERLMFGSGDFYLICQECGRYWAMIDKNNELADLTLSNQGAAAHLSGHMRVKDETDASPTS